MDGLLIIDKPEGMTSHDVVQRVRRLLKVRRVGHAGTLDPMATGVLLVALGEGTRIVQFLMAGDKTYQATLKLGEITDTQDVTGEILDRRPVTGLTKDMIIETCRSFEGTISQIPPMYSALKKNGIPLHRLARRGIEVAREARQIKVRRLSVTEIRLPYVTLEVDCSKGTYIRTLCHDIGLRLGSGAHLVALRRTRNGIFTEDRSIGLQDLESIDFSSGRLPLLSLPEALGGYPAFEVTPEAALRLRNGIPPSLAEVGGAVLAREGDNTVLLDSGKLLAVARFAPSRENEKRGDFELLRVFNRLLNE